MGYTWETNMEILVCAISCSAAAAMSVIQAFRDPEQPHNQPGEPKACL